MMPLECPLPSADPFATPTPRRHQRKRQSHLTTYRYDGANRLIETVTGGITTTYAYDGWGNLIRETVDGVTSDLVLDERGPLTRILAEVRSDGSELLYAYGPEGFAAQASVISGTLQPVLYPLLDALGSVRHLTDANGAVVRGISYEAFGRVRHSTGTAFTTLGFTGERMGVVDGTVYLRARHYQPALGRFLQRDTFPGIINRPQSLNRYVYVQNNPVLLSDPSGRDWWEDLQDWLEETAQEVGQGRQGFADQYGHDLSLERGSSAEMEIVPSEAYQTGRQFGRYASNLQAVGEQAGGLALILIGAAGATGSGHWR